MSDEEKQAMKYFYNLRATIDESNMLFDEDISIKCGKETIEQITLIINLIEKQQKEIEELKDKNKSIVYNYEMVVDKLENSTPNDKIKAKIEEYKKQLEKMEKDDVGIGFTLGKEWSDLKAKVEFGQSLLEKE